MSIDGIAVQAAPRKQLYRTNGAKSLFSEHYEGENLNFINMCEEPTDRVEGLYAKVFREAVNSVPKQAIRVAETRMPYDLRLCATNRMTGKSVSLHAKTLGVGLYTARVWVSQNGKAECLDVLTANDKSILMSQYKTLRDRLVNYIK